MSLKRDYDNIREFEPNESTDTSENSKKENATYGFCPEKRTSRAKKKFCIDIICLCLLGFVYATIVCLNAFQSNRATVSESEKRNLASPPHLTVGALLDGSFFQDAELYVSDTFWNREKIILLSKKIDNCFGFSLNFDDEIFAVLSPDKDISSEGIHKFTDEELKKKLEEELKKQTDVETSENTTEKDAPSDQTEEIGSVKIDFSKTSLSLAVGSGTSITYTVESNDTYNSEPEWIIGDENIISVSAVDGKIDVRAIAEGETTLTCKIGQSTADCFISVYSPQVDEKSDDHDDADFFNGGLFLYGDAVYVQGFYSETNVGYMAQCADYYSKLFPNTRISVLSAPVSSMLIDNIKITEKISNQKQILTDMGKQFSDSINYVNIYDTLYTHKNEYLFFKSDHHWTARGAYYAYCDFAESVGLTPVPLSEFDYEVISENYHGSMYSFTQDERVLAFSDIIETFSPRLSLTMTVTDSRGAVSEFDSVVIKEYRNYISFIAGDNAYTVINVPENPQDMSILVFKDSYGNAFVPFLTEHYGNIIVIDPRHCSSNVYEMFADYGLTDILFLNNIQCTNSYAWTRMYFNSVGIDF